MDTAQRTQTHSSTRVTFARDTIQSAIAAKLKHTPHREFLPSADIKDDAALRQDYDKLRAAYKLQRDIALEVDLDQLLRKIMDSLFDSLRCDRGAILLYSATGELEPRFVKSRKSASKDHEDISISNTIITRVLQDRAAILSSDASLDVRFGGAQSIIMQGIRSTMSVPLIARDDVLGIIHLDSLIASSAFTQRDLSIVQGLADQAALAIEHSRLILQREKAVREREKFSRLVSPNLVDQLVHGSLEIIKGGENRVSTVLFSDLRGFTSMSERLAPAEVVHMLNEYFEIMVDIVFKYDGTLDKYMGDGLMAVFGSPVDIGEAPRKAVQAGLEMQEALTEFNELRASEGLEEMYMGIGIDTGPLVAGYMGSTKTMSYTVIGPPVNLSSRLCGIARPGQTLISEHTRSLLGEAARADALEAVHLKGIKAMVTPYNVTR